VDRSLNKPDIMTEEKFADLFSRSLAPPTKKLQPGQRLEAVVVGISKETVFLDIGAKSEGCLAADELRDENGELRVGEGDRLQVYFVDRGRGEMIFTTRLGSRSSSDRQLETAFRSSIPVEGKVTREIKGGFEVMIGTTRAFCPYSQLDIRRIDDAADYLERSYSFRIIEYGEGGRNIVVSARVLLEEEREEQRRLLENSLEEGMRVKGRVSAVRDFGAFVDIGGIDGLIPRSELAWGSVDRVDDLLSVGMEVEVVIKSLDWERQRISLSLRETTENPWNRVAENYPVGSIHTGRVGRLTHFGAFVTLKPGVDGLLHISKLGGGRRIHHPREVLEEGQELTVRIDALDPEKKRLALVAEDYPAQRQGEEAPADPAGAMDDSRRSMGTLGDLLRAQLRKGK